MANIKDKILFVLWALSLIKITDLTNSLLIMKCYISQCPLMPSHQWCLFITSLLSSIFVYTHILCLPFLQYVHDNHFLKACLLWPTVHVCIISAASFRLQLLLFYIASNKRLLAVIGHSLLKVIGLNFPIKPFLWFLMSFPF